MLAGHAIPSLLVGHEAAGGAEVIPLGDAAVAALRQHRLLDVLLPYIGAGPSPAISLDDYEHVLKHHCVADINVTVYDNMAVVEKRRAGSNVEAVLTDGRARWELHARWLIDDETLPAGLPEAIIAAASVVDRIIADLASGTGA